MFPLHLCRPPLVLLALALTACAEVRRGEVEAPAGEREKEPARPKGAFTDLNDLQAEVAALQALDAFALTPAQLDAWAALAAKTAQEPPPRKEIRASQRYRKALLRLREALRGGDPEAIDAALEEMDAVREKEDPEFDPVEITDAARRHAPEVFDRLNARQVVGYLAGLGEHFPDPAERLAQALAESRKLRGKEWRQARDDAAFEFGWLVGGLDAAKEEKARDRAAALLDRAHVLEEKDYERQRGTLDRAARDLVGDLKAMDIIRRYVERALAETLSNHRLAAAIKGRKK